MIVNSLEQLYINIREDFLSKESSLYIADRKNHNSELEELLVQMLDRNINDEKVTFLAIRNIVIRENLRSKGNFKHFLLKIENLQINLIFHDVVNPQLLLFLEKNNYIPLYEEKYGEKIISMYKLF